LAAGTAQVLSIFGYEILKKKPEIQNSLPFSFRNRLVSHIIGRGCGKIWQIFGMGIGGSKDCCHGKDLATNCLERQSRNQRLLEMPRKKAHGEHGKNLFRVLRAKFRGKKSLLL